MLEQALTKAQSTLSLLDLNLNVNKGALDAWALGDGRRRWSGNTFHCRRRTQGIRAPHVQTDYLNIFLQDQVKMADFNAYNLENVKTVMFSRVQLI